MITARSLLSCSLLCVLILPIACSRQSKTAPEPIKPAALPIYTVDPMTAGSITGVIRYKGKKPTPIPIDMSEDPACVEAHHGKAYDESLLVGRNGALGNAFIYIKGGLEGKNFAIPLTPVTIDQSGCWFHPRVLGMQTGQVLQVVNSDPVTHNIHPMAVINREWNHSQGSGDPPINRKFLKTEVMIPVKCNIHRWMHAYIGVVDNPYFAVSKDDGTYKIENLPPGTYTLGIWQEKLGTLEQQVTVSPQKATRADVVFEQK